MQGQCSLTRSLAQQFRVQSARGPDDRFAEIDATLHADHPELAHWWRCRSARDFGGRTVLMDGIRLVFSLFRPVEDPDCLVLLQTPAGAADRSRVAALLDQRAQRAS